MAIATGNLTFFPNPYKTWTQGIIAPDGNRYIWQYAKAKLTNVLQSSIPLMVPQVKPYNFLGSTPDVPLAIPVGAQITRVTVRLPRVVNKGDTVAYGIELPPGATMIGTTGENLKVSPTTGTTQTVVSPVITSANNLYDSNAGAVLQRTWGQTDQPSPSLLTTVTGSPLTLQITVSNAANTAAGNGIRLSQEKLDAFIYASVVYRVDGDAIRPWQLDLPAPPF